MIIVKKEKKSWTFKTHFAVIQKDFGITFFLAIFFLRAISRIDKTWLDSPDHNNVAVPSAQDSGSLNCRYFFLYVLVYVLQYVLSNNKNITNSDSE